MSAPALQFKQLRGRGRLNNDCFASFRLKEPELYSGKRDGSDRVWLQEWGIDEIISLEIRERSEETIDCHFVRNAPTDQPDTVQPGDRKRRVAILESNFFETFPRY